MKHFSRKKNIGKIGRDGERAVAQSVRQAMAKAPHHLYNNLYFLDERGHPFQIDHLLLTPAGVLVIESKHWSGIVYGDVRGTHWSYVPRGKGMIKRFYNPMIQNRKHIEKLLAVLGEGIPMFSCVVFSHPRGEQHITPSMPDNVFSLAQFDAFLAEWKNRKPTLTAGQMDVWHRAIMSSRKMDEETKRQQIDYACKATAVGQAVARREYYKRG